MAKLMTMFLVLIAIQAVLILYQGQTPSNTSLWAFVTGVNTWSTLDFLLAFLGISSALFVGGVVAGSIFGFKTDFIVFAPLIAGLVSIGAIFINLAQAVFSELVARIFYTQCPVNGTIGTCTPADFIIAIILGPIAFFYFWTVISWWRGQDY